MSKYPEAIGIKQRITVDKNGFPLTIMRPKRGASFAVELDTATAVPSHIGNRLVIRVWSIGGAIYLKYGTLAVCGSAATTSDAFIPTDDYADLYVESDETHIRANIASGTPAVRVEVLE